MKSLLVLLSFSFTLTAETTLTELVQLKSELAEKRSSGEFADADSATYLSKLQEFFIEEYKTKSYSDVLSNFPDIKKFSVSGDWKKTLKSAYSSDSSALPIAKLHSEAMSFTNFELLCFRLDRFSTYLRGTGGYMKSMPPVVILKSDSEYAVYDFKDWKYSDLNPMYYSFHGVVIKDNNSVPDIIVSLGPVGSGSYVYFTQLHYEDNNKWTHLWKFNVSAVGDVRWDTDSKILRIITSEQLKEGNEEGTMLSLTYGGKATRTY